MRTIKFRAKCFDGYWVYGDLHLLCDQPHIHTAESPYPFAGKRKFIDPDTVGQFTGLKDKNGCEIYEGDIIRCIDDEIDIGYVVYSEDYAKFIVVYSDVSGNWFDFEGTSAEMLCFSSEVIGNVYDNKELLTQK